MKKIYSFLVLFVLCFSAKSQVDFTIGTATGVNTTSSYPCPIQDFYEGSRSQFLYTAAEMQAAGMSAGFINSIKFTANSVTASTGSNFPTVEQYRINIGTTATTSLDNTIWETGTQTVWGPLDYTIVVGVNEFIFTTPFFWNGTDNIVLDVCNGDPNNTTYTSWTNNAIFPWTTGLGFNASHTYRVDNNGNQCDRADILDNSGFPPNYTTRPDITFNWISPTPCSGAPTGGITVSTKDSVCAGIPFSVYVTGGTASAGMKYQWDSSLNGVNFYPMAGDTGFSYSVKSGITVNTWYRRHTTCVSSTLSAISTPFMVYVRPYYECYCGSLVDHSLHTTSTSPTIESVAIVGGTLNYTNNHPGSNQSPVTGYAAFTDTTGTNNPAIPLVRQASSYTMTVTTSVSPTNNAVAYWVDWNHNGTYDSAEFTIVPFVTGNVSGDVSFDVPANAPLGLTMMRIRATTFGIIYSNPCTNFFNGETEDYIFKVLPGVACTGTPLGGTAVTVDSICPGKPFTVSVDFTTTTTGVTNLKYQWQDSSAATGGLWVNISAADTNKTYTNAAGITIPTWYRRKITCTSSNLSAFSSSVSPVIKQKIYCYCSPLNGVTLHTSAGSPTISEVDIVGGTVNVVHNPGLSGSGFGYTLYDDTTLIGCLTQANTYSLTVQTNVKPNQGGFWVDWDGNNLMDLNEYTPFVLSGTAAPYMCTADITVPQNAPLGVNVLRIRVRAANFTNSCDVFGSGQTVDYAFLICAGIPCSGKPIGGIAVPTVTSICPNIPFDVKDSAGTDGVTNLHYQWQYSLNGTTWINNPNGTVDTTRNLTVSQGITVATYYRRIIKCTLSNLSDTSVATQVTMNSIFDCYCGPNNGTILHSSTGPTIEQVDINGCSLAYSNSSPGAATGGYSVFYDSVLLSRAVSYTMTITASAKPTFAGVWIDWNHSGSFDATEYQQVNFATGATTADVIIAPDANALLGTTLMRVRFGTFTTTNACQNFFGGETEDYVIKITAGSPCAGTPIGGAATASVVSTCNGIPFDLSTTGTSDCNIGLVYQWQDSSAAHNWQALSPSQTGAMATGVTQNVASYYRRKITCTNSGLSSTSASVFVDQFAVSFATLPFVEDFENTWDDGCGATGSHTIPNNYWRSYPLMGDSSWRRNDDGASANWIAATSASYTPTASTGTYSARFHTFEASSGTSGNLDLFLNCTSISPTKNLTFDYINNDGSDSVQILLSTDGGTTFSRIGGVKTATAWTTKSIDFNSTSATTVIRFRATSDFGFTDFGLDNVNVVSIINVDAAATTVVAPTGSFTATSAGTITVSITNAGVSTIDFSTNPATVGANVTGPSGGAPVPYTKVVNTGTLAVGASMNVTITTNANFSAAGTYCIKGGVSCLNDGNPSNDSTAVSCVNAAGIPLYAIANGFWGDGSTWSTGTVPTIGDTATITGFTVTLGGAAASPYSCGSLGMGNGGTLVAPASKTLNIGSSAVSNKSITFAPNATLNISGGTVNVNGFVLFNDSSNFIMSAGNLNIDGNNGTDAGSVPAGVDILGFGTALKNYSFGTINLTGGTIKVVDPHRFIGNAIGYRGSVSRTIDPANTIVIGDAASTHTSNNNGFVINISAGSQKLYLGSLTINGGNSVGNRFVTSSNTLGVGGDLTINANSDFRVTFPTFYAGNITNNGTFASGAIFNLQSYTNGVAGVVNNAQTISGSGVFRNNVAIASVTAPGAGYAVGDILTLQGGTFVTPATIYVTAVGGTGNITSIALLNMGNYSIAPTGAVAVTGGSGTGATFSAINFASAAQFASLTINNKSAAGVTITSLGTLLASQTGTVSGASGNLTLIAGIVKNTPTITLGSSITQRGNLVYTSGLFTGKFSRWFNAATNISTTGDFPVGKTTYSQTARVEFTTAPTTGGTLTAEFVAAAPGYGGIPLMDGTTQIVNMANDAYWRIDASGVAGGNYTLSLTDSGIVNAQTVSTLVTLKRPSNTTIWGVDGTQGTNTGTLTKPTVVRTGLSGFSEFAIGGASDNILPVSAFKLTGSKVNNANQLSWTAINETEVKGYDLQRSTDGTNFNVIAFVLSKENGTVAPKLDYTYSDNNSITTDGYYRLKQIAKDGTTLYSNVVLIKGSKVTGIVVGNIFPNPVKTSLNVVIASSSNKQVIVKITDMSGKQIMTTNYALTKGDNNLKVNLGNIAVGTYAVTVFDADGNKSNVVNFVKE